MADFQVRFAGGVTWSDWADPERAPGTLGATDKGAASRLAADDDHPQKYTQAVLAAVTLECSVDDGATWAPVDAALGGRLFYGFTVERPVGAPPAAVSPTSGQTAQLTFLPTAVGHWTLCVARHGGGRVLLHLDVSS